MQEKHNLKELDMIIKNANFKNNFSNSHRCIMLVQWSTKKIIMIDDIFILKSINQIPNEKPRASTHICLNNMIGSMAQK